MDNLRSLTRKELQKLAKENGIKANLKNTEMIYLLEQLSSNKDENNNQSGGNRNKAVSSKNESRSNDNNIKLENEFLKLAITNQVNNNIESNNPNENMKNNQIKKDKNCISRFFKTPPSEKMRKSFNSSNKNVDKSNIECGKNNNNKKELVDESYLKKRQSIDDIWNSSNNPIEKCNNNEGQKSISSAIDDNTEDLEELPSRIPVILYAVRVLRQGDQGVKYSALLDYILLNHNDLFPKNKITVVMLRAIKHCIAENLLLQVPGEKEVTLKLPSSGHLPEINTNNNIDINNNNRRKSIGRQSLQFSSSSKSSKTTANKQSQNIFSPSQWEYIRNEAKRERYNRKLARAQFKKQIMTQIENQNPQLEEIKKLAMKIDDSMLSDSCCAFCGKSELEQYEKLKLKSQEQNHIFITPNNKSNKPFTKTPFTPATNLQQEKKINLLANNNLDSTLFHSPPYPSVSENNYNQNIREEKKDKTFSKESEWVIRQSRTKPGRYYYYNPITKVTTWNAPSLVETN